MLLTAGWRSLVARCWSWPAYFPWPPPDL